MEVRFRDFWSKYVKETAPFYEPLNVKKLQESFSAFICGSDQIWAPNQFNSYYFLDFVNESQKKIAYAPSIGLSCISSKYKDEYARLISSISCLSVRGDEDAKLLKTQFGIKAESVLDPTMLLNAQDWEKYLSGDRIYRDAYIFCYLLGDQQIHIDAVVRFAAKKNLHLIVVAPHLKKASCMDADLRCDLGPAEWLRAIKDARYVITDSYHGMLFSIIFRKDFFEILRFSSDDPICQNSRIASIANKFDLENRVLPFGCQEIPLLGTSIDYTKVFKLLDTEKYKSMAFLRNSLAKVVGATV
jgi:hypothetical protein